MGYRWITARDALIIHEAQLVEHGGKFGFKDENALESAMMRARHKALYGHPAVHDLAASYAWAIAKNHPFIDGKKRVALVVCESFLEYNGYLLTASDEECVEILLRVAASEITEEELSIWISGRISANVSPPAL